MSIAQACQWFVEHLKTMECRYGITFTKGMSVHVFPVDEEGQRVIARDERGRPIDRVTRTGRYKSTVEEFKM
jgi:hypothetical protein